MKKTIECEIPVCDFCGKEIRGGLKIMNIHDYVVAQQEGKIDIFKYAHNKRNDMSIALGLNTGQLFVDVLQDEVDRIGEKHKEIWYTVRIPIESFKYCEDESQYSVTIIDHLCRVATQIIEDFGDIKEI